VTVWLEISRDRRSALPRGVWTVAHHTHFSKHATTGATPTLVTIFQSATHDAGFASERIASRKRTEDFTGQTLLLIR
jgi:hypothetical protein